MFASCSLAACLLAVSVVKGFPLYNTTDPESPYQRDILWVGGDYQGDNTTGQHNYVGQMYVEKLTPIAGVTHPIPLLFISGGGQTGALWLNTPDGRTGWATWYLQQGYSVYIVDPTYSGRSAYDNAVNGASGQNVIHAETIEKYYTATASFSNQSWAQAVNQTQWPGTGKMGDPTFDTFAASFSQDGALYNTVAEELAMQKAGAALLDRIGNVILVCHGLASVHAYLIADARPQLVEGITLLESAGPPFEDPTGLQGQNPRPYGLTDAPITYNPPVSDASPLNFSRTDQNDNSTSFSSCLHLDNSSRRNLTNLHNIPILIVTGEASFLAPSEHCNIEYLNRAGVNVTWWYLPNHGYNGNGYFFPIEMNNLGIANLTEKWIGGLSGTYNPLEPTPNQTYPFTTKAVSMPTSISPAVTTSNVSAPEASPIRR